MLNVGHLLQFNNRRWHIRHIEPINDQLFILEAIGASDAAQGMSRRIRAIHYGDDLFLEQGRQPRYWRGNLNQDWLQELEGNILHCQPITWLEFLKAHTQTPPLGELPNIFTWSYSRMNRYHHCPRAYYYHYYAAWDGWLDEAPAVVRRAYLLKNLTDVPRWIGTLLHETIKFALARLKAGQPVPPSDLIQQMYRRAQADYAYSSGSAQSQGGHFQEMPNQFTGFQEHYYHSGLSEREWQAAWQRAQQHLTTFLNSDLYAHLQTQPADTFLDVETLQSFQFKETTVWVQMDFAHLDNDLLTIYDWKTGTVGDEATLRQQLGIYALFFQQTRPAQIAGRRIRGVVYDLPLDQVIELPLDETTRQQTEQLIATSLTHLQGLLLDPAANTTTLDNFPMIDDLTVCRRCQFRELCNRE